MLVIVNSEINNTSFWSKRIHHMLWSLREIFKRNYSLKFERGERNYEQSGIIKAFRSLRWEIKQMADNNVDWSTLTLLFGSFFWWKNLV